MDLEFTLDTDHRKRRRNRTTQSCLNCHTSKRKCDRKRPCQRCIQLGLTGLCVYEIDDPALRDDPTVDENTRLRNRIAELESLVRELRGKPHPKWAENNFRDGDPSEKWHSRAAKCTPLHKRNGQHTADTNGSRSVPTLLTPIKTEPASESSTHLYRFTPSPAPSLHYNTFHADGRGSSSSSYESGHRQPYSVSSSPSVSYHGQMQATHLNGDQTSNPAPPSQHENGGNYARNGEDGRPYEDQYASNTHGYCPCRNSPATAVAYLPLQQQLRSSLSSIRQYMPHASNTSCLTYRRIVELHNLLQGSDPTDSTHSYDSRTPSEIMSPISASSGHASFHTGSPQAVSPQEWNNMTTTGYNPYFPITSGEHNMYSHVMT
jgi:hypothetical protein